MKLNDLRPIRHERFSGIYRLTGRMATFDDEGIPYLRLRLSGCSADHVALAPIETAPMPEKVGYMDLLSVAGQVFLDEEDFYILLTDVRKPTPVEVAGLPALQTLPRAVCAQTDALDQLVTSVQALTSEPLKGFLKRVLERRDRLDKFLKAPASQHYHHNCAGGLLTHSVEVGKNVINMCRMNEPNMSATLQETGFVAGLLHDIGKVLTNDVDGRPMPMARLCQHDALTLEVCASGLSYLDRVAPDIAVTLRHVWTCRSPGARYGAKPALTLARYVRDADGQSAMSDNQQKAYVCREPKGFGYLGKNAYWLPSV